MCSHLAFVTVPSSLSSSCLAPQLFGYTLSGDKANLKHRDPDGVLTRFQNPSHSPPPCHTRHMSCHPTNFQTVTANADAWQYKHDTYQKTPKCLLTGTKSRGPKIQAANGEGWRGADTTTQSVGTHKQPRHTWALPHRSWRMPAPARTTRLSQGLKVIKILPSVRTIHRNSSGRRIRLRWRERKD